jgi:hypothetical protein
MNEINLKKWLPPGSVVRGILLSSYDPVTDLPLLDQDIVEIELPNGMTISIGWFPEQDLAGHFRVTLFRPTRAELVRPPVEVKTPFEVAKAIERFAGEFTPRALPKRAI